MSIAQDLGYPLEEDHITLDDLHSADEVLLPERRQKLQLSAKSMTIYSVGSVTRALREAYENLVRGKPYRKTTAT